MHVPRRAAWSSHHRKPVVAVRLSSAAAHGTAREGAHDPPSFAPYASAMAQTRSPNRARITCSGSSVSGHVAAMRPAAGEQGGPIDRKVVFSVGLGRPSWVWQAEVFPMAVPRAGRCVHTCVHTCACVCARLEARACV
jgi:hypothetical protein